nr:ethylene-responsive transcription factor TINY-like [Ipomoea trifida]
MAEPPFCNETELSTSNSSCSPSSRCKRPRDDAGGGKSYASTPPQEDDENDAAPPSPAELGEIVELPELRDNAEPTRDEFIFVDSYGWDFCHPWSHLDDGRYVAGDGFDAVLSGDFDSCLWQHY